MRQNMALCVFKYFLYVFVIIITRRSFSSLKYTYISLEKVFKFFPREQSAPTFTGKHYWHLEMNTHNYGKLLTSQWLILILIKRIKLS